MCNDGNVCTVDWCSTDSGCHNDGTGVTDPCNDGSACTVNDTCQGDAEGTCTGTSVAAPHTGDDDVIKNRYLSFTGANPGQATAIRVTFVDMPAPLEAYEGRTMWVGAPIEYCENSGQNTPPQEGCAPAPGLDSPLFVAAGFADHL
jgi:hypothetical protein